MALADLVDVEPEVIAAQIAAAHAGDPGWLDAFTDALHQQRTASQARRVFTVWGINHSEAGRMFGVTRQAVSRWIIDGIPATQTVALADLATATDILTHYVKADRIPAVVRRPAPALDHKSLLDLVADGRTSDVVDACRRMFQFTGTHQ